MKLLLRACDSLLLVVETDPVPTELRVVLELVIVVDVLDVLN